jgi:hypothetical protein
MARTSGKAATRTIDDALWGAIRSLTDAELNAAIRRVAKWSQTNCAWWQYRMRDVLGEVLAAEKAGRRAARKRDSLRKPAAGEVK